MSSEVLLLHDIHDELRLLGGAEVDDVHERVDLGLEGHHGAAVVMELFAHQHERGLIAGHAADFLGKAHVHEASLAVGGNSLLVGLVVAIHFLYLIVTPITIGILLDALNKQLLFVGEIEVHKPVLSGW